MKQLTLIVCRHELDLPAPTVAAYRDQLSRYGQRIRTSLPVMNTTSLAREDALAECLCALKSAHGYALLLRDDAEAFAGVEDGLTALSQDVQEGLRSRFPHGLKIRIDRESKHLPETPEFTGALTELIELDAAFEAHIAEIVSRPPGSIADSLARGADVREALKARVEAQLPAAMKHPETAMLARSLMFRLAQLHLMAQQ